MTLGFLFFDPLYFLILAPAMILAGWASWRVKHTYALASRMPAASGMTGAEAAHMIMKAHNITNVGIEESHGGQLSDHYDPRHKVLRLSPEVYSGRSVASLGIAAHEAGHAVQDAVHYGPLKIRNGIVPLAGIGSQFGFLIIFVGVILGGLGTMLGGWLIWLGIGLFSTAVFFQLVNLPVEFDASNRAKQLLTSAGLVAPGDQTRAMYRVLNAAAWTYVAATLSSVLMLLYLLVRSGVLGGNRN